MNDIQIEIEKIREIVKNTKACDLFKTLKGKGYRLVYKALGSGGVLSTNWHKDFVLVQVTCGKSHYNYADAVMLYHDDYKS